jgi:DNA-binding response OmpR family regulator
MSDPITVLVAERDDALRDELIDRLSADAFDAGPARSVAEVRCRAARGPDLVLLGELEDRLGALRLLRAIRSGDALACRIDRALPVIVLSGEAGEWAPLRAFEAGCDDFVRKPVRYLELRARLSAVLRRCDPQLVDAPGASARSLSTTPARGALCRASGRGVAHGVGAPHPPRRRPAAGVHQARAAAGRVGLQG